MEPRKILIANRGEIGIRIARACAELKLRSVAVYPADDAQSLHVRRAEEARSLSGRGARAYLDIEQLIAVARESGCGAVHPGYGFLSESAEFAQACRDAGLVFIGPSPDVLRLFGNKVTARGIAVECGVPVPSGTSAATTLEEAESFFSSLPAGHGMLIKAVAGGGGRGMRVAIHASEIEEAYARCRSEAKSSFGVDDVYVEELIRDARHIEIQVIGDGTGAVSHLGERECSLQRRHQKVIEIAPSPTLSIGQRELLTSAAKRLATRVNYQGLGTFEFLVEQDRFAFIECNPRLQVEHTITEEVFGVDLVKAQVRVCLGETLSAIGLDQAHISPSRGHAIQLRVNMETMQADGSAMPAGGTLTAYEPPSGPGIRVDGYGYAGYRSSPNYDSLLAKIVVHADSPVYADALLRARRAVAETRIEGIATNLGFIAAVLSHPDVAENKVSTRWLDEHAAILVREADLTKPDDKLPIGSPSTSESVSRAGEIPEIEVLLQPVAHAGCVSVVAVMPGVVIAVDVAVGDVVHARQQVAVLEAMKMQHVVQATADGTVRAMAAREGDLLGAGDAVLFIEPQELDSTVEDVAEEIDLDHVRPDLAEVVTRHAATKDEARPDAVARRRKTSSRTARENVADLVDEGSFIEYGALTIAAQRSRHSLDDLIRMSPADGIITGIGTVNAKQFGLERSQTVVLAYDYTVFAGTQGTLNHKKQDRIFILAAELRRPLVLFAEGGGGRPGDTDKAHLVVANLIIPTFKHFARLSGLVPLVGVVHGRCFAGNAALLGCCDVIIATRASTIGMGGPAMIEGGGLGVFAPEEVGPAEVQTKNGVIDLLVDDEAQAVAAVKKYLSYFQGPLPDWRCDDQRHLRRLVPENRKRAYDVREVIRVLADIDSVLELRPQFGHAIITALVRIEGRPMGLIANNPMHLGGAIDAQAADKAARFIQLCDAHDLPVVSLCDTPGFMVGPEAEKTAQVRHVCRMFVNGASLSVPLAAVVLRKSYGLGAMAMGGGCFGATLLTISWPTGEFGGMGLEGAVRLGFRKELDAIKDPQERAKEFDRRVAAMYERGKALNVASLLEIDDVIDPADTRRWIVSGLAAVASAPARDGKKRSHVDTW